MMTPALEILSSRLQDALGDLLVSIKEHAFELTVVVDAANLSEAARVLRDHPDLRFDQLIDLCGVDYLGYAERELDGSRYAVVYHLLSVKKNRRVRLRVFCPDDAIPAVNSVMDLWPVAGWFEREAFDLFGIIFEGHADLRRLLTDYGFIGHPFRKDFPLSGNVEMRYDPDQRRVVYQPVSIDPREVTPRIVREENYGELG